MTINEVRQHNKSIQAMKRRNQKKLEKLGLAMPNKIKIDAEVIEPEEEGICSYCHQELTPIYENNGFTEPEGPSKWEISGYKPCNCQEAEEEYDER